MIPGLHGSLLSHDALSQGLPPALRHTVEIRGASEARAAIARWYAREAAQMGPATSIRAIFDRIAAPLALALGFRVTLTGGAPGIGIRALLEAGGRPVAALLVTEWGRDLSVTWREAVRHGIGSGLQWCCCFNGPALRVVDARRTYTRRFAQFDIAVAVADASAFDVLWGLLGAHAFSAMPTLLDRAVLFSEQHRATVRASLQHGVEDALTHLLRAFCVAGRQKAHRSVSVPSAFDESLTVIYRVLFLLFAEARGLVPQWHPTYRESYTIESLREMVELFPRPRGVWESLQAIARLAHRGCDAGALRLAAFNGRLFSPAHAPLAESSLLDDGAVRQALLALTTRAGQGGRVRISYADLGVEQLGGVYERILDFEAASAGPSSGPTLIAASRRKTTGSFYTPRSLTEYVVRRALAPLVHDATPDQILDLRVLDPAMGSGAFLVAACRYLASAYEVSLAREGADITIEERAGFRRTIAQRCLYGVDLNPMAVQLGRLSLWLATLSGDRPLTFLDHHLRAGNSLVGASLADVARQPPSAHGRSRKSAPLPLFRWDAVDDAIGAAVGPRIALARDAGDTLAQIRAKERMLAALDDADGPVAAWKGVADLWCAGWFNQTPSSPALYRSLLDYLSHAGPGGQPGRSGLPGHVAEPLLSEARDTAVQHRFFHWTLEFPEVFFARDGLALENPGFDAVIGNPPWEMLRADHGDSTARLTAFARGSGIYALQGDGHANLYQLFLERSLSIVRRGGRLGLILPSGFATDHGCAALRRHALDRSAIDTFVSVENRDGLFPIHRGLKFLLVCATAGGRTSAVPLRSGVRAPEVLDRLPDIGPDEAAIQVPRALLERTSGEQLSIPAIGTRQDLALLSRIGFSVPALGDADGWHLRFGRELNASDDRTHFIERTASSRSKALATHLPVLEGKQIQPFAIDLSSCRFLLPAASARRLLSPARAYQRARLAYRDVASPTNRLTLIAAIVPPGVVTTHTLFCLKDELDKDVQQFLCGVFNSYVANYLVRLRVSIHVSASIIGRLPVPKPPRDSAILAEIASLSAALGAGSPDRGAAAQLQAAVARLYGLTVPEFDYVLSTFPLIDDAVRRSAAEAFAAAAGPRGADAI